MLVLIAGEGKALQVPNSSPQSLQGRCEEGRARTFSGVWWEDRGQMGYKEKFLHPEDSQAVEQSALGIHGVLVHGWFQDLNE